MTNRSIELEAALLLALEALNHYEKAGLATVKTIEAITAIKEVLMSVPDGAQPEQHSVSEHLEPVALQMDVIVVNLVREGINKHRARELAEHFIKHTTPPQRTWVGLTEEEVESCFHLVDEDGIGLFDFAEAIEAKLKEKNT